MVLKGMLDFHFELLLINSLDRLVEAFILKTYPSKWVRHNRNVTNLGLCYLWQRWFTTWKWFEWTFMLKVCRGIKRQKHLTLLSDMLKTTQGTLPVFFAWFFSHLGISQLPWHPNEGFRWTIYSFTFQTPHLTHMPDTCLTYVLLIIFHISDSHWAAVIFCY